MPAVTIAPDAIALASIVYRSRAVDPLAETALLRLLARSRENNAAVGVTGVLVYDRACFFQWLEGPDDALTDVMNRVRGDRRHGGIEVLVHQAIPSRLFPGWSMTLASRADACIAEAEGLFRAAPDVLDELHVGSLRVQMVLASLCVPAWTVGRQAY